MKMNSMMKLALMAAVVSAGAVAPAMMLDDAKILIDRALNSPTLTIKYSGANTAMVELRLNGVSIGTREVDAKAKAGETTFTLDLGTLKDGENEIEVRLFDKAGKLVGKETNVISTSEGERGPVYLIAPKVGETVMGTMDVKVGFGKTLTNKYVSFFVNNQFRSMTNTAPFAFSWDTTREANGWHELEAWVVDDQGQTFKTRKVKIFVNNPGGRTNRPNVAAPQTAGATTAAVPKAATTGAAAAVRPNTGATAAVAGTTAAAPAAPRTLQGNGVNAKPASAADLKPITVPASATMGSRTSTPTPAIATAGALNTKPAARPVIDVKPNSGVNAVNAASGMGRVSITKGTRLPDARIMSIVMAGAPVKFDVQPRVENGIPLTPFRHLFEADGGKVDWDNLGKILTANKEGSDVWLKIGDKIAKINKIDVELELAPYIESGRTIVPLSFIKDSLNVEVEYDAATGHVLIRRASK